MKSKQISQMLMWLAIIFMIITGLVHLLDAQDALTEAAYKGWLFYANSLAAVIATIGIFRGEHSWGWNLGALVALGAILGYVASRTVGLPQIPAEPDAWLEPLGLVSLAAEGAFLVIYGWVMNPRSAALKTA